MKIEIGESLLLSYLKHVKKCTFYQNNWKVSNTWNYSKETFAKVQYVYNKIIDHSEFSHVFKSELNQLLKQSEIDAIGLNSDNTIYTVDIAFHEAGLQYGGKIETRNRVFKKLLRSYLTILNYFPDKKYELLFASPKVNPATETIITNYFSILERDFGDENVTFKYISNDKFYNDILLPTISKSTNDSDTNELFIRAISLNNLFQRRKDAIYTGYTPEPKLPLTANVEIEEEIGSNNVEGGKLEFIPNQKVFKQKLLEKHIAHYTITKFDGTIKKGIWQADNFDEDSNLVGNIRSGILRDWKTKGIIKAVFEV